MKLLTGILVLIFWVMPVIFNFHMLTRAKFWKKDETAIVAYAGIGFAIVYAISGIPGMGLAWDVFRQYKENQLAKR